MEGSTLSAVWNPTFKIHANKTFHGCTSLKKTPTLFKSLHGWACTFFQLNSSMLNQGWEGHGCKILLWKENFRRSNENSDWLFSFLYLLVCNSHSVIEGHHCTGFCCYFWKQSFSSTGNERDIHIHPTKATGHGISDWLQFSFSRSTIPLGQSPILQYNNKANKNNNNKTKLLLLLLLLFKTSIWNSFPSCLPYVLSILSKLLFGRKFGLTWKFFFF